MNVQIILANGGPEVLQPATLERPSPGPGQVLVRVAASSVNTADLMARSMGPVVDFIPTPPAVLGMDFAGTVEALGEGVQEASLNIKARWPSSWLLTSIWWRTSVASGLCRRP
jgi:NADPH2:quinone reductase